MDYPIQRARNGLDLEQPNTSSSDPPSNFHSDQSLAIGVDSQRFNHNEQQSRDFEDFLKEAEAKERRDRRAGFHVEQTSIIENASLRTPRYQKRHRQSRAAIFAACAFFVLSLASSVASLIIIIQDTLKFGPRASHVIWLIISFAFTILLAMILLLLKWRHDHLKRARTIVLEELKLEAAREEAISEQSSAYNEHLRNIERRSYEAATEAQKVQRALGKSLDTHQSVIEVMATAYARLKSEMVLQGIDENDLANYQSGKAVQEEAADDEGSMQRNTASGKGS